MTRKPTGEHKPLTPSQKRLIEASSAIQSEPSATEMTFMARALVQATLPHRDPGDIPVWGRSNGHLTLTIKPDWEIDPATHKPRCVGVPYGVIPRLLLFWITTEAVRTKTRRLKLGDSLAAFMRQLGMEQTGGRWGTISRLREQMNRLFRAKISFDATRDTSTQQIHSWLDMQVAPKGELWWNHSHPEQPTLWESWIELGESFYEAILAAPVPVDMRVLKALKNSPLALDLYAWLNYRAFTLNKGKSQFIPWRSLAQQLGADYSDLDNFRKKVKVTIRKVQTLMPRLRIDYIDGGLVLHPGMASIAPKAAPKLSTNLRG